MIFHVLIIGLVDTDDTFLELRLYTDIFLFSHLLSDCSFSETQSTFAKLTSFSSISQQHTSVSEHFVDSSQSQIRNLLILVFFAVAGRSEEAHGQGPKQQGWTRLRAKS
jgi:hypothetical protein